MKNRNNYLKQLQRCLTELGTLVGVFKKMPPEGAQDLKTLQKHEILEIEFAIKTANAKRKTEEARKTLEVKSSDKKRRMEADARQRKSIEKYYRQLDDRSNSNPVTAYGAQKSSDKKNYA